MWSGFTCGARTDLLRLCPGCGRAKQINGNTEDPSIGEPVDDSVKLGHIVREAIATKDLWDRHFETFEKPPLELTYEYLNSDPVGVVDQVLEIADQKFKRGRC